MKLSIIALVSFLLIVGASEHAYADEKLPSPQDAVARAHLDAGNKAYRLKDFEAAIREYRAGAQAETGPTYTFWYNLGQSYRQLGRYEDAIWFYSQFLAQAPATLRLHRDAATGFIEKMKAELDKAATAAQPTEPAPTPIEGGNSTAADSQRSAEPRVADPRPSDAGRERWYQDRLGWAVTGAGAVGLGLSVSLVMSGRSLDTQANAQDQQAERRALREKASTRMLMGGIAGGIGAIALGVGAVMLARTPAHTESRSVGLIPLSDGAAILVRGSF
jgi:tetratricopeptide (TPR) repeat protein